MQPVCLRDALSITTLALFGVGMAMKHVPHILFWMMAGAVFANTVAHIMHRRRVDSLSESSSDEIDRIERIQRSQSQWIISARDALARIEETENARRKGERTHRPDGKSEE